MEDTHLSSSPIHMALAVFILPLASMSGLDSIFKLSSAPWFYSWFLSLFLALFHGASQPCQNPDLETLTGFL